MEYRYHTATAPDNLHDTFPGLLSVQEDKICLQTVRDDVRPVSGFPNLFEMNRCATDNFIICNNLVTYN